MIDNFRLAHARMPFIADSERKLWAVWTKEPPSMEAAAE